MKRLAMSLTVTLPAPAAGNAYFIINSGGVPNLYYDSVSTSTYLVINPPASLGSETLSTTGGTFTVGTAAAVPEPSTLVLMGIAGITGLGYAWRTTSGRSRRLMATRSRPSSRRKGTFFDGVARPTWCR